MIVVDTDVVSAFWIRGDRTAAARRARKRDGDWVVPPLWRSEFRSVLRQYLVGGHVSLGQALWFAEKAEADLRGSERAPGTAGVLQLVERTGHSAYDCEYVALAEAEGARLVTGDRTVARLFPATAVLLEDFAAGG